MSVRGTGNTRSYFSLDVRQDGENGLAGQFSDGNSLMLSVHAFTPDPIRGLLGTLWYEYGLRKPVTAITEWWLFEAWWTNEVFRRTGLIVKHPRELQDKVHTNYGIITTVSGTLSIPDAEMYLGVDLANLPPMQFVIDWHRTHLDKFLNRKIDE